MAFNAVTVLFRLLSEDNVSGVIRKVRGEVGGLERDVNKSNTSFNRMKKAMHDVGLEKRQIKGVTNEFDGTAKSAEKAQDRIKRMREELKRVGASDKEIQRITEEMKIAGTQADKTRGKLDRVKSSLKGIGTAAGAALAGMSLMSGMFIQQSITAAVEMEKKNVTIGGIMGLNTPQSVAASGKFTDILSSVSDKTGRGTEELRTIMPSAMLSSQGDTERTKSAMTSISGLGYVIPNADIGRIAVMYNKMQTSGSPMALGNYTISLADMGLTTAEFKALSADARQAAMDAAIAAKIGNVNANMAETTAGRMARFQAKWTIFQAKLGDAFVPMLIWAMDKLTPFLDYIMAHHIKIGDATVQLTSLAAGIILAITALGLMAGPLVALQILFPGAISKMWAYVFATEASGDAAVTAASRVSLLAGALLLVLLPAILFILNKLAADELKDPNWKPKNAKSEEQAGDMTTLRNRVNTGGDLDTWGSGNALPAKLALDNYQAVTETNDYFSKLLPAFEDIGKNLGTSSASAPVATTNQMPGGETPLTWLGKQLSGLLPGAASAASPEGGYGESSPGGKATNYPGGTYSNNRNVNHTNVTGGGPMTDPQMGQDIADLFDMSRFNWVLPSISKAVYDTMVGIPAQMGKWGLSLIQSLANGIWNGMPSVTGALDWLRSQLPNSPPKQGPLSHTTESTWFNWTSGLANAGMKGLSSFDMSHINANPTGITPTLGRAVTHTHYHAPITIDASHMNKHELMALMTDVNESVIKPKGIPAKKAEDGKEKTKTTKETKQAVTDKTSTGGV